MIEEKLNQLKSLAPEIKSEVEALTSAIHGESCTKIIEYLYQIVKKLETTEVSTEAKDLIDEVIVWLYLACADK